MEDSIRKRAKMLALYMVQHQSTVRSAAKAFGVSKSTVHKDLTQRLSDPILSEKVRVLLAKNKAERHLRGGLATKEKYKKQ